jgi:hypothetical protein
MAARGNYYLIDSMSELIIRVWTPLSTGTRSFLFPYLPLPGKIVLTESAAFVYPAFISGGRTTGP